MSLLDDIKSRTLDRTDLIGTFTQDVVRYTRNDVYLTKVKVNRNELFWFWSKLYSERPEPETLFWAYNQISEIKAVSEMTQLYVKFEGGVPEMYIGVLFKTDRIYDCMKSAWTIANIFRICLRDVHRSVTCVWTHGSMSIDDKRFSSEQPVRRRCGAGFLSVDTLFGRGRSRRAVGIDP